MRTLKYVILGLLARKPMTGYDITKEFEAGIGLFWHAKHSQIYPELNKLTDEKLIAFDIVIQGEKMEKKLYTITEKGRYELRKWLLADEPLEPTPKDVFKLRVYLSEGLSDQELMQHMQRQQKRRMQKLKTLKKFMTDNYEKIDIKELDPVRRADYFVLSGAILREQAYVDWLKRCIELI
jgi:DNA-binding PadR family transcriptional regulator